MPEQLIHTQSKPFTLKRVLVGTFNALKPESQGKKMLEWYDKLRFPKFTKEDQKVADNVHVFLKNNPKLAGWGAIIGEAALLGGIVAGFRNLRQGSAVSGGELRSDDEHRFSVMLQRFSANRLARPEVIDDHLEQAISAQLSADMYPFVGEGSGREQAYTVGAWLPRVLIFALQQPQRVPDSWDTLIAKSTKAGRVVSADADAPVRALVHAAWQHSAIMKKRFQTVQGVDVISDTWKLSGYKRMKEIMAMFRGTRRGV